VTTDVQETTAQVLAADTLRGYRAMITGAGSGIGRAIALRLATLGCDVVGLGRHEETLSETARLAAQKQLTGAVTFTVCDVRDTDQSTAAVESAGAEGGLDLLVNNAGGQFFAPAADISLKGWRAVIDLNLTSVFALTQAAYPHLAARSGSVVNLSLSGVERGGMGMAHSIAARSGVLGLTRTLALEWAREGVRVNCIGPGTVLTHALSDEASDHVLGNLVQRATPMRRPTPVEDVAELVAYLASPAGRLMTGQMLQVDGGAHLGAGLHMLPEAYA